MQTFSQKLLKRKNVLTRIFISKIFKNLILIEKYKIEKSISDFPKRKLIE